MPTERLEHEITELAAHINAGCCRWLELVAEFDRRRGWWSWSTRSCAEWVAWQCGISPRAAREHVRVARRLSELPRTHEEFAAGRLSYAKVRAITRIAEPDSEGELVELAHHATAAQLELVVRGLRRVSTAEAEQQAAARYLVSWWEEDGSLAIRAQLPAEEGALFMKALDAAHDRLRGQAKDSRGDGPAEPRSSDPEPPTRRQTHADALVEMASASTGTRPAAERCEVVVHVDLEVLSRDAQGQVRLADGPALAPETARRLACDASLVPVIERGDRVLSVGRMTRAVPPAIRRALESRDGACRFPGCEHRRFLQAHHIVHWAKGGQTSKNNLILLCHHHHRMVHEGHVSLTGHANTPIIRRADGTILTAAPPPPQGQLERLIAQNRQNHDIGPRTVLTGTGERMDRDHVMMVMAAALHRRGRDGPDQSGEP